MARSAGSTGAGDWHEARQVEHGAARRIPRETAESWADETWTQDAAAAGHRTNPDARKRFRRLDRLAWVLDRSIPVGRWRIGLDPILGLMPGAGDFIGTLLSLYVLYEGARLGAPRGVLLRMGGNVLVESVVGVIPFLGDAFDFMWQANTRNMRLIHRHHGPDWRPRSLGKVWLTVLIVGGVVLGSFLALALWLFKTLIPLTGL